MKQTSHKDKYKQLKKDYPDIWLSNKGQKLAQVLKNCKSQCWDCHLCEDTFQTNRIDSALQYK